jgi:hypothetical protein
VNQLNWSWIALALTVPPVVGGLVAYPLWRTGQPILGNLTGTTVIFGAAGTIRNGGDRTSRLSRGTMAEMGH